MQKFFPGFIVGSILVSLVGCGSSSSSFEPSANTTNDPKVEIQDPGKTTVSPFRFRLNKKEINENAFNEAIAKELARYQIRYSFEKVSIRQLKFNTDRTWSPSGNSVELTVSGEVCKEGQLVLGVHAYQNDFAKLLAAAAGLKIPYRLDQQRSLLEMPAQYENQTSVFGRGYPKLEVVDPATPLTSLIADANRGSELHFDAEISDRNIDFTLMKALGKSQYLLISVSYAPFGCGTL